MDLLKVTLLDGDKKAEVEAQNIQSDEAKWVFNSLMSFMGKQVEEKPITNVLPSVKVDVDGPQRRHKLPLIGGSNSNISSMADALKKVGLVEDNSVEEEDSELLEEEKPDTVDVDAPTPEGLYPGIRYIDDVTLYRCRYWCKNCGNQGNRYIELGREYIKCHNCKTKHAVRPATGKIDKEDIPETDRFGNYYRADAIFEEPHSEEESVSIDGPTNENTEWTSHTARSAGECSECETEIAKGCTYYKKPSSKKRVCSSCYQVAIEVS